MVAAIHGPPAVKLVTAGGVSVAGEDLSSPPPRLVAFEGRRALIFANDPAMDFHFRVSGEPVAPIRVTRHGEEALRGLNLLRNASFTELPLPWRVEIPGTGRIDRDIAETWTLEDGHTAFVASEGSAEASVVYIAEDGSDRIPAAGGRRYEARGLFGLHRCEALLRLEALRADGCVIACVEQAIEKRLGGRAIADYAVAAAALNLPHETSFVRLSLALRPLRGQAAHLFFTRLSFSLAGAEAPPRLRPGLMPLEAVEIAQGACLLECLLPPLWQPGEILDVLDEAGQPLPGAPVRLADGGRFGFAPHAFDGVGLAGALTDLSGPSTLVLLIDDQAAAFTEAVPDVDGRAEIALRIPDAWLDGQPHTIALVDAASGLSLFRTAEVLRALLTPGETADAAGRSVFAAQDQGLARERYRGLAAHLRQLAAGESSIPAALAVRCHAILTGHLLPGEGGPLSLPCPREPEVTVIVFGLHDAAALWRCAAALIFAGPRAQFETLLLDPLPTGGEDLVSGLHSLGAEAEGVSLYGRIAARARGRRIVFLEAGCEPVSGWLEALSETFTLFDNVGVAGPKILDQNGRLVEAGRVVWASGAVEALSFGGNPRDPRASYARQVDLLAPDAIMIECEGLALLAEAGEIGHAAVPDAAEIVFTLAQAGRRIVYTPAAEIVRGGPDPARFGRGYASGSPPSGTSPDVAFRRRWFDAFRHNPPPGTPLGRAADRNIAGRVLVLDLQLPRPDVDAGSYAAEQEIHLLQALGYKVTVLPLNLAHLGRYAKTLQARGVEVLHAPFVESLEDALAARADAFDLVYMTRYNVARIALPLLRRYQRGAKRVLNVADLHFLRELRAALAIDSPEAVKRSQLTRETELALMREVDLTLSYTEVEAAVILSHHLGRTKVAQVPWVAPLAADPAPLAGRRHLAFLGSFGHRPNVEAMQIFARQVMPRLRARLPGIELHVYGSQLSDEVRALESPAIMVRGHAATVAEVYNGARVFLAPLVSGAGIKGKVIGAMAHGCPTVLSPVAAEGIGGRAGRDFLLAEAPETWVEAIAVLCEDDVRWQAVAESGRDLVQTAYGVERGVTALRRALESIDILLPRRSEALCGR
jgi:glycosyltransferase involved in cell wall biosynthesis